MALLDLNDLEVAMNRTFTGGEADQAQYYIDLISALVEGYTGVSFQPMTGTLRAKADAYGTINIDYEPVTGVSSVIDYQTQLELNSWSYDGLDCVFGLFPFQVVDITFTYGAGTAPPEVVAVATEASKRAMMSFPGAGGPVKQHAVGDVIDVYDTFRSGSTLGQYFNAGEMEILDSYKETNRTLKLGADERNSLYYSNYPLYLDSNYPEPFWW